ncbi:MAG: translocation/assembly module TamB domain-containing protein [Edaphocola sp.]
MAQRAVAYLSAKLKTKVGLRHISIGLMNSVDFEGLFVADRHNDTLLYAGAVSLRITDWFFLKDEPVISYIGLSNAYANLHRPRNSDQWNYQFVIDAFAGTQPASNKQKPGKQPRIDLRKLELHAVRFDMVDEWAGSDMVGSAGDFTINARDIDFAKKLIDVSSIKGNAVTFGLRDYKGGRPPKSKNATTPTIDTTPFNPDNWKIACKELALTDSRFFMEDPDTKAVAGYFDPWHMDVTGVQITANDITIDADTLTARLGNLSCKERCGLELRKMRADITVSPRISECKNLFVQTANSTLKDYYAMHYQRFPDFEDYLQKVVMESRLNHAEIGIKDIAYFAPELVRFGQTSVRISGEGKGTVAHLKAKNLDLTDGFNQLKGDLAMDGLPDIDKTLIGFSNGWLQTSLPGAYLYAPALRKQAAVNLNALKTVEVTGSFTGFISAFNAKANIRSGLGSIQADMDMRLPEKGIPAYGGKITASSFALGALLHAESVGNLSGSFHLSGTGFDAPYNKSNIQGNIYQFDFNGYSYRNLSVDGLWASKKFAGKFAARDTNLVLDFDGSIDFSGKKPEFDFYSKIQTINLKQLHFGSDNLSAKGETRLNFTGDNIDNFIGKANIYHLDILRDSTRLNIDSLTLTSAMTDDGNKALQLVTNELTANVTGNFSLLDLPSSVQLFLGHYLPKYVAKPAMANEAQVLNFEIKAGRPNDAISIFAKNITIDSGLYINGSMDMARQTLALNATVPSANIGGIKIDDIQISGNGNYEGFRLNTKANGLTLGSNDLVDTISLTADVFNDTAKFQLTSTSPANIGTANIQGLAVAVKDSLLLRILPSRFFIGQSAWNIDEGNKITFSKKFLGIEQLRLSSGLQEILINEGNSTKAAGDAEIKISNIDVAPLHNLFPDKDRTFDGRINGTAHISSILDSPQVDFDIATTNLTINKDTLGALKINGNYVPATSLLTLKNGSGLFYKEARAQVAGTYCFSNNVDENVHAGIEFQNARLNWLQPILSGYVHNLTGILNGKIQITGAAAKPVTSGLLKLDKAGITPDIIGVHYNIDSATISVSGEQFDIGKITITDDDGRQGILSGSISHKRLSNMSLRFNLRSDNIKVVDLTQYQNANFYGDVKASVQLRLNGPANNLNLNIFAIPQKNSHLFIPISYTGDVGAYDYVHFKQHGTVATEVHEVQNKYNIRIDAVATPDLEATIILDPATGDQIWAKGSGNITLEIPSEGDMKMNGNYVIDEGKYNFSFKQLQVLNYKRQFSINSNSAIKWNGDISDADLDVTAYTQVKTRLYDLIINEVDRIGLTPDEVRDAKTTQMVNVNMTMRGSLKKPEMRFRLDLAENRSVGTYAYQKLQRVNQDDKELLNQVASLLLLDQFIPPEGISNTSAVASGTINNMSELIGSAASSQVTNFANKILGMEDLYVGLKYKNYNLSDYGTGIGYSNINRNEAGINLRKNFLNNRLIVEVGGVYDWGLNSSQSVTTNLAGDFRVQYLLTEDGRIRFNVFRTSNYDALFSQLIARQGVGLGYRKSFSGLTDLFRNQEQQRRAEEKRLRRQKNAPAIAPDTATTGKEQ